MGEARVRWRGEVSNASVVRMEGDAKKLLRIQGGLNKVCECHDDGWDIYPFELR